MDDFKAFDYISTTLDIQSGADRLFCKNSSNCRVTYKWSHTPIWYYLSSPIMYHGQHVSLYLNPMAAPKYKAEDEMFADIRLDTFRFTTESYTTENNLKDWSTQGVRGIVRSPHRTLEAELEVWFRGVGYAYRNPVSSTTCNWDATDCYFARIYPHIDEISESGGSTNGGQTLTISGNSFGRAKSVEVTVDDVVCEVKEVVDDTITCVTGPKTLGAAQAVYPGEHGLYRDINGSERVLLTSADIPTNWYTENTNSVISGFYEAPVDGEYQFHMSCDDTCDLRLALSDPMNPDAVEEVIRRKSHTSYRNFYYSENRYDPLDDPLPYEIGSIFSTWIPLVGGQKYYMQSNFGQGGGEEHWTIGVEIRPTVPVSKDHPHLKPGKSGFTIHQDGILRDTAQLRVNKADGGTFRLLLLKEDLEYWRSDNIVAGCSANSMKDKIKGFYKDQFKVDPNVSLSCELFDGTPAASCDEVDVTDHVYTIEMTKSIDRPSVLTALAVNNSTLSNVSFVLPENIQLSTPTLKGSFFLECWDTEGNPYYTVDLHRGSNTGEVYNALVDSCPWLRDAVSVWNGRDYAHSVDGVDFIFYYHRLKGEMNPVTVYDSLTDPLVGIGLRIEHDLVDTYGPNVYYDVLPFEQVYTADVAPPVLVKIDGMPALCKGGACSYQYASSVSMITGFTVTGQDVQITGTSLPVDDLTSVRVSN